MVKNMNQDSLESLINNLKQNKIKAIEDLFFKKEVEQYFVDFKITQFSDYTGKRTIGENDRKNLAKAISGFGNSEGGLLIWGINTHGSNDFANSKKIIKSPEQFSSLINSEISRLTVPTHPTVENFVIKETKNSNEGFVVTSIPKYEGLPIQVIANVKGKGRFFMRAGDSFVDIPQPILSGMFGRRPNPKLTIRFRMGEDSVKMMDNGVVKFNFGILITNTGKGIARDIFINCYIFGINADFELKDKRFSGSFPWVGFNLISEPNYRLGPGQTIEPIACHYELKPPFEKDVTTDITVGAEGQVPTHLEKIITKERIEETYVKYKSREIDNEKFAKSMLEVEIIKIGE